MCLRTTGFKIDVYHHRTGIIVALTLLVFDFFGKDAEKKKMLIFARTLNIFLKSDIQKFRSVFLFSSRKAFCCWQGTASSTRPLVRHVFLLPPRLPPVKRGVSRHPMSTLIFNYHLPLTFVVVMARSR